MSPTPPPTPAEHEAWLAWKTRTFGDGYHIWHEGLDLAAVTRLRGSARAAALTMLRRGLALGDPHAARALAALDDPADLPAVRAHLERSSGAELAWLVATMHERRREPALARRIFTVLQTIDPKDTTGSGRLEAAIVLRHFAGPEVGPEVEAALLGALTDPAYLVRYHASESLLALWRVNPPTIADHPDIFAELRDDTGDRERARALLLALTARVP